ncbi:MAG: hypothetical protein K6G69_05735 [Lachnospiraceae bacterium]|nr:hypothetical protein [Lachnospiraceae bacterium]
MAKDIDKMISALSAKKVPIATLDNKWHRLFAKVEKTDEIEKLEKKLNELLRRQGKINNEIKEIKKIKKNLMDEIVALMENESEANKVEKNKKLIDDCNAKIDAYNDENMDLPKEIGEVNKELMTATMDVCYDVIKENEDGINQLGDWLAKIRVELKKNVVRKQEMEIENQEIYSYMHDIFGAEVIELFDMKYNPDERQIKKE